MKPCQQRWCWALLLLVQSTAGIANPAELQIWAPQAEQRIYFGKSGRPVWQMRGILSDDCWLASGEKEFRPDPEGKFIAPFSVAPAEGDIELSLQCEDEPPRPWRIHYRWIKPSPFFRVRISEGSQETGELQVSGDNVPAAEYLEWHGEPPPSARTPWQSELGIGLGLNSLSATTSVPHLATLPLAFTASLQRQVKGLFLRVGGRLDAMSFQRSGSDEEVRLYQAALLLGRNERRRAFSYSGGLRFLGTLGPESAAGFQRIYGLQVGGSWIAHKKLDRSWKLAGDFFLLNGGNSLPRFSNPGFELAIAYWWRDGEKRNQGLELRGQWFRIVEDTFSLKFAGLLLTYNLQFG